jgi:hypothetical protein
MSFLHTSSVKRLVLAVAAASMLAVAIGASAARRHDPRMDDAGAALEKAAALLAVADCTTAVAKNQRDCERSLQKSLAAINSAQAYLADAMLAADGGSPLTK